MGEIDEQPEPAPFAYRPAQGYGRATVVVGGQDVSELVRKVAFIHEAGAPAQVFIDLTPKATPGDFECEAVVHVREVVQEDPADACLRFLEPIDPQVLDQAVLSAMEMGGPQTYGAAFLEVLRSWARGD